MDGGVPRVFLIMSGFWIRSMVPRVLSLVMFFLFHIIMLFLKIIHYNIHTDESERKTIRKSIILYTHVNNRKAIVWYSSCSAVQG